MPFIRNLWYVAMWSELLPNGGVFGRTILEEPIAFFRTATGALGAVEDTCPHRLAPLRLGSVSGENLRCGYHGLEIDAGGACVYNPHGNHTIPPAARIRSYPVIEKHTLIWIWMGDGTADSAQIPDFSVFDGARPELQTDRDYLHVRASYELITNNLLDLSHTSFLHDGVLGTHQTIDAEQRISQDGNGIRMERNQRNVTIPPMMQLWSQIEHGDIWRSTRWDPPGCNPSTRRRIGCRRTR